MRSQTDGHSPITMHNCSQLIEWVHEARLRTCELVADLTDGQLIGPRLPTINPLLWELGHVAWFQEKWVLRHRPKYSVIRPDADSLYDSSAVAHASQPEARNKHTATDFQRQTCCADMMKF